METELILSIVIASCTVLYTIINLMMWFESRASRKAKISPLLVAFLKTTENHMNLVLHIKNIGEGYAKNVKLRMIKDYNQFNKKNLPLSDIGIAKNGMNVFPPNYELSFYIHSMNELGKNDNNEYVEIEITYKDQKNKNYRTKYKLPFNQIFGQNYSSPPETYIGQIPHYLKEINNTIKKGI